MAVLLSMPSWWRALRFYPLGGHRFFIYFVVTAVVALVPLLTDFFFNLWPHVVALDPILSIYFFNLWLPVVALVPLLFRKIENYRLKKET